MDDREKTTTAGTEGRSRSAVVVWLVACVAFATVAGWLSTWIARSVAPLVVFPLLLGFLLGACLSASRRMLGMTGRKLALGAALLAAGAAVWGQHYASYREAWRVTENDAQIFRQAQLALGDLVQGRPPVAPSGLLDYLRREAQRGRALTTIWGNWTVKGWQAWTSWAADAALVLVATLAVTAVAMRPRADRGQEGSRPNIADAKTGTVPETKTGAAPPETTIEPSPPGQQTFPLP